MERGKVDLRNCVAGDILISALGAKLEYISPTENGSYNDHIVKYLVDSKGDPYPKDCFGTRTHDGYQFRKKRLPEFDHDIVKIIPTENFEMRDEVERMVIDIFTRIGCDIPDNWEDIVQFIYEDVLETADKNNWHSGDVAIGFRRWIESVG